MKRKLLIIQLLALIGFSSLAQDQKLKLDESKKLGSATKSEKLTTEKVGEANMSSTDLKWRPILTKKVISLEPETPGKEVIEALKAQKLILKQQSQNKNFDNEMSTQSVTPIVGTNYLGNVNSGSSPMDNHLAISNGGWIVSVANSTIEFDNMSGSTIYYNDIVTFMNDPLITSVCDPYVLYDKIADRFIFFCQTSPVDANSKIMVCFSKTNDPNSGWWVYKLTGNPLSVSEGFDYPKLAISNNELYITGNLFFEPSGTFDQAILYQIQKSGGYSGGTLNWQYWTGIAGSPFTLVPVGSGQGLSFGPGCYMVATSSAGASTVKLYDLTDDMTGSPVLNYYSVSTTAYSPAADASQLGTPCLLDNGDCRSLSGFYLNGIIHFVFQSDIGSGWNGINYNRLTVGTLTNVSSTFGSSGSFDYSYPSVVSFATAATDKSVMIGFGRSSSAIYPEVRVVNCDNAMGWSGSTFVKSNSYVNCFGSATVQRWGDYTGTARKHNSASPSIWMNGMYGNASKEWDTWVAEIHTTPGAGIVENQKLNDLKVYPNPIIETFSIEFSLSVAENIEIGIFDITGKMVKEIYKGKGQQGINVFSFNKSNLAVGTYFLTIKNYSNTIKNEKIIIAN